MSKFLIPLASAAVEERELSYSEWQHYAGDDDSTCLPQIECAKHTYFPNLDPTLNINKLYIRYEKDLLNNAGDRFAMLASTQELASGAFELLGFGFNETSDINTISQSCLLTFPHDYCGKGNEEACKHLEIDSIPRLVKSCYDTKCVDQWHHNAHSMCQPTKRISTSFPITDGFCRISNESAVINPNTGDAYAEAYLVWKNARAVDALVDTLPTTLDRVECNKQGIKLAVTNDSSIAQTWVKAIDSHKKKGWFGNLVV